jgi:hypothetical protein
MLWDVQLEKKVEDILTDAVKKVHDAMDSGEDWTEAKTAAVVAAVKAAIKLVIP